MRLVFFLFLFLLINNVEAQIGSPFEKINTSNGLPTNYIFCVAEDLNNNIWAGSDKGLLFFNGLNWETFDTDNGIPGNYVNNILIDKSGDFFIGISEKGLYRFDTKSKKTYPLAVEEKYARLKLSAQYLTNDKELVACYLNNSNDSLFNFMLSKPTENKLILLNAVKKMKIPNLIGTKYSKTNEKPILYLVNNKINKYEKSEFLNHKIIKIDFKNNFDYDFLQNVFLGFSENYIGCNNFLIKVNGEKLKIITTKEIFGKNKALTTVAELNNDVFMAKLGEGFCIIDSIGNIKRYTTKNGLSSNEVDNLFIAKDGTVYISTLGGGINILKYNNRVTYEFGNKEVKNIQNYNNKFYANTKSNIYEIDKNGVNKNFSLPSEALTFLVNDKDLYVGNFKGLQLQKMIGNGLQFIDNNPITAGISSILKNGEKYFFTTYGSGIYFANNKIVRSTIKIPFQNIEGCNELSFGYAALSNENGFFTFDNKFNTLQYFTTKEGLLNDAVNFVHEYRDTLWVACKNGISTIYKNKVIKNYTFEKGFSGKNAIYIFTDNKAQHWVVSDLQLHKLVKDNLKAVGSINILLARNDKVNCAAYNTKENTLAIGTKAGLCILDLKKIDLNTEIVNPKIWQARIGTAIIEVKNSYELAFDYQNISFNFANISGLFKRNIIYYKLENYNKDWQILSDSLVVSFDKLRPGNYKLFAKAINADGVESEIILMNKILIEQPIWFSPWMMILYILGLALVLYKLSQYLNNKKYKKKLQVLEMQQQLENERQRISKDLHDNMGAYTSALLANVDKMKLEDTSKEDLENMKSNAEQILASLRETIWVLNNKEISVHDFSDSFTSYCFKILKNFENINFEVESSVEENHILPAATAIHLNKIMQEAFQNCIKHSACTLIKYRIVANHTLLLSISDNGKGYNVLNIKAGNGLENMEWRANEIGANLKATSDYINGTEIIVSKKIL